MPEEKTYQLDPLDEALAPLESSPVERTLDKAVEDALERLLTRGTLQEVSLAELEETDSTSLYRGTHILSLVRLLRYLREDLESPVGRAAQAHVALSFVKVMDANRLAALQLGRGRSDERLREEVGDLREQLSKIASYKAVAITQKSQPGSKHGQDQS